jgi:hypothetical protein
MWDCKYKIGQDGCRLRKMGCYPGGRKCVLYGKFEFPFREEPDALENPKKAPRRKKKAKD